MMHTLILPSKKTQYFAWGYLAFQTLVLSWLISFLNLLLPSPLSAAVLNFVYFCLNFAAVVIGMREFLRRSLAEAVRHLPRILLVALGGLGVYLLLNTGLSRLLMMLDPGFANLNDRSIASMTGENLPLMTVGTVLLVPLTEESLHRGGIFGSLRERSRPAALLLSPALFSLIHILGFFGTAEPVTLVMCFVQYLPAGLCLAAAYELSGNLAAPVLIHMAVNAIGILAVA